jgi:nucleotide-binding universal stress UspA family protein
MRILVPVDLSGCHQAVYDCLESLAFQDPQIDLISVVSVAAPTATNFEALYAAYNQEVAESLKECGESALNLARQDAEKRGLEVCTNLVYGYPAPMIAQSADALGCELIAIGADRRDAVSRFMHGSVTMNVASGAHQSLLISRTDLHPKDRVSAVFATDHSDYANRCLDRLLSWKPNIAHIQVLTAYEPVGHESARAGRIEAISETETGGLIEDRLREKTEAVAAKIRAAGIPANATVVRSDVHTAIQATMRDHGANLLILGAKGHALWERMLIGSTTMHQLLSEPHSLLILRAL